MTIILLDHAPQVPARTQQQTTANTRGCFY